MSCWFARTVLVLSLALAACEGGAPAPANILPADREEMDRLLAAASAKAEAYSKARERGLRDAFQNMSPAEAGAPCATALRKPPPFPDEGAEIPRENAELFDEAHFRMNVVPAWAVLGEPSPEPLKMVPKIEAEYATRGPRRDQFNRQHDMLKRMLADGKYPSSWTRDQMLNLARELGSEAYWGEELDVVAAVKSEPTHDESDLFKPGLIVGKAFVWSFPEGRVKCAATVTATNRDSIKLRVDPNRKGEQRHQRLTDDLKNEAYRAALDRLRALAPGDAPKNEKAPAAPSAAPSASSKAP